MRCLLPAIVIIISATAISGCGKKGYPRHLLVEKVATKELQALLVAPKATEPTSTVIVLGGSDGGYQSAAATAQELAEQGIAALATAGQVLLLAGTDDQLWPSAEMSQALEQQFAEAQQPSKVQALYFKDAGHVIAPGAPNNIAELTTSDGTTIVLGGNPTANQSSTRCIARGNGRALQSAGLPQRK